MDDFIKNGKKNWLRGHFGNCLKNYWTEFDLYVNITLLVYILITMILFLKDEM